MPFCLFVVQPPGSIVQYFINFICSVQVLVCHFGRKQKDCSCIHHKVVLIGELFSHNFHVFFVQFCYLSDFPDFFLQVREIELSWVFFASGEVREYIVI